MSEFRYQLAVAAAPTLYVGDPNQHEDFDKAELNILLPTLPDDYVNNDYADAKKILDDPGPYITYLRALVEEVVRQRLPFQHQTHMFWIRLNFLTDSDEHFLEFPIYDHLSSMERLMAWMLGEREVEPVYFDIDQGWDFHALPQDGKVVFHMGDGEVLDMLSISGETYALFAVPDKDVRREARAALDTAKRLVKLLTEAVGADVWSRYLYDEEPTFGTADWTP